MANKNDDPRARAPIGAIDEAHQLDPGMQALSKALRLSFLILKVIMLLLVAGYLVSGFFQVDQEDVAIVMRFGKIRHDRWLGPGVHWAWPFPIDEVIKLDARASHEVSVPTFWYSTPEGEAERALREEREESRDMPEAVEIRGDGGFNITGDLNLLHSHWRATYTIDDPILYFLNVMEGETGIRGRGDERSLVTSSIENSVVRVMGGYEVYDAMIFNQDEITTRVREYAQERLNDLQTGIRLQQLSAYPQPAPPRPVANVFEEVLVAAQERRAEIDRAWGYANGELGDVAGAVGIDLFELMVELEDAKERLSVLRPRIEARRQRLLEVRRSIAAESAEDDLAALRLEANQLEEEIADLQENISTYEDQVEELPPRIDELYARAGGEVQSIRAQAETYKHRLAESARGDAEVLRSLLEQFPGEPQKLQIFLDHYRVSLIEDVLDMVEDKWMLPASHDGKVSEFRLYLTPPQELIRERRRLEETR